MVPFLLAVGMIIFFGTYDDTHISTLWDLNHEHKPNHADIAAHQRITHDNVTLNTSYAFDLLVGKKSIVDDTNIVLQRTGTVLKNKEHKNTSNSSNNFVLSATEIQAADSKDVVAVCFFGQVKNYDLVASSTKKHILNVLESENFAFEIYAHTYNQTSFTNPRNREKNISIDPFSLEKYFSVNAGRNISIVYDDVATADGSFDLKQLLKYGDPWPENPIISLRNMARQLYSLRRLTALWAPHKHRYKYCLYIRPDLLFAADLDLNRTRPQLDNGTIATPDFAQFGGLNDRLAIGTPAVMHIYGSRADELLDYVLRLRRKPHAETFLLHAMRSRGIRSVGSAVRFQRMRADGSLQ